MNKRINKKIDKQVNLVTAWYVGTDRDQDDNPITVYTHYDTVTGKHARWLWRQAMMRGFSDWDRFRRRRPIFKPDRKYFFRQANKLYCMPELEVFRAR